MLGIWAKGYQWVRGPSDCAALRVSNESSGLDYEPLGSAFLCMRRSVRRKGKRLAGEVFVLNNPKPLDKDYFEGDKWQSIEGLNLYNPPLIDARITRQKALFTIQAKDTRPIKDIVSRYDLTSHLVPAELKKPLLEILYLMGIDRSTLFPNPDGLCDRINWETKNRIERHFPRVTGARVVHLEGTAIKSQSRRSHWKTNKEDPAD